LVIINVEITQTTGLCAGDQGGQESFEAIYLNAVLVDEQLLELIVGLKILGERFRSFILNPVTGNEQTMQLNVAIFDQSVRDHLSTFRPKAAVQ
jgi:hypothetical protein